MHHELAGTAIPGHLTGPQGDKSPLPAAWNRGLDSDPAMRQNTLSSVEGRIAQLVRAQL